MPLTVRLLRILMALAPAALLGLLAVGPAGPAADAAPAPAGAPAPPDTSAPEPTLALIQPGSFQMGSPPGTSGEIDERRHAVRITRPYLLGVTEVTRALWRAVMGGDPAYFLGCDECPVENVTWFAAIDFCNALSREQGLTPVYDRDGEQVTWDEAADGYRLPTEAEWEYACRAGTSTLYDVGDCLDPAEANYDGYEPLPGCPDGMSRGEPVEVGSFPPNAWGLFDMHGNVSEWCWDWYEVDPSGPADDPRGPRQGTLRVFRGGSWNSNGNQCRAAFRQCDLPRNRSGMTGLRLARSAPPMEGRP